MNGLCNGIRSKWFDASVSAVASALLKELEAWNPWAGGSIFLDVAGMALSALPTVVFSVLCCCTDECPSNLCFACIP